MALVCGVGSLFKLTRRALIWGQHHLRFKFVIDLPRPGNRAPLCSTFGLRLRIPGPLSAHHHPF
eukprot:295644-Rhodomonas_salina.3